MLIIWDGYCAAHAWVKEDEIVEAKRRHPGAKAMAHPECGAEVLRHADHVCSTSGMISYARESGAGEFIVFTEAGILHRLKKDNPGKRFQLGSKQLICPSMKLIDGTGERLRHISRGSKTMARQAMTLLEGTVEREREREAYSSCDRFCNALTRPTVPFHPTWPVDRHV